MPLQPAGAAVAADVWAARRQRARDLAVRWPFAAEVLGFYGALVDVQAAVFVAARRSLDGSPRAGGARPDLDATIAYIVEQAMSPVCEITRAYGPEALAAAAEVDVPVFEWKSRVIRWCSDEALAPTDRFLVRAASAPVFEALGGAVPLPPGRAHPDGPTEADAGSATTPEQAGVERRCPRCGGLPQLSVLEASGEDLVAPRRSLECSRCMSRWAFPRLTCPACGEADAAKLPIFAEEGTAEVEATGSVIRGIESDRHPGGSGAAAPRPASAAAARFPHLSIHACRTCSRYLLNVNLARDARAVPVVDELAAIPLDLYAREQGLTKVIPNLMGL